MPIAEKDVKLLWGRAAGHCSNPDCRDKVSETNVEGGSFLTGEMAHIIARNVAGPRGGAERGANTYDNLILLCPTCHTKVDKAPAGIYPVEHILDWKAQHENWVDSWSSSKKFETTADLMQTILSLLEKNRYFFDRYGPKSDIAVQDPASSAYVIWMARRLDTLLLNNRKIVQILETNQELVPEEMAEDVLIFKDHAQGYEQHIYERLDHYTLFPEAFSEAVKKWSNDE